LITFPTMLITDNIRSETARAIKELYGLEANLEQIVISVTRPDFQGDFSLVVFPLAKMAGETPEKMAEAIGQFLSEAIGEVASFEVVKGFLNISLNDDYFVNKLTDWLEDSNYGQHPSSGKTVVLEYCGPNTNKPLHLGHVRNMVIGYSVASILSAYGHNVHKVNIYNDRGIAICKSMIAWKKFGNGETPESSNIKGDKLVGNYYVGYEKQFRKEVDELVSTGSSKEEAEKQAPIYLEAKEMLRKWEDHDEETLSLWNKMNEWVYDGFNITFLKLGVDFEKDYHESETYLSGKDLVYEGLEKGIFYKKEDQSVWVDLSDYKLDEKVLLRSDGTSVYLTQDLGTAQARYNEFSMDLSVYVVANEQDYHFQALKNTLKKLGKVYADGIFHLSYGMVDLPTGKMKSREGTTVDADDLMEEMNNTAEKHTRELGKIGDLDGEEATALFNTLGLGALKYFLLKVNPKKRILFNPEESIEFHGDTGPFIQYTHARIQSILRKGNRGKITIKTNGDLHPLEKEILIQLHQYPGVIEEAATNMDPSEIANYIFFLAKLYNKFYAELSVLGAANEITKSFRINLSDMTARVIRSGMKLLGIEVPDKM